VMLAISVSTARPHPLPRFASPRRTVRRAAQPLRCVHMAVCVCNQLLEIICLVRVVHSATLPVCQCCSAPHAHRASTVRRAALYRLIVPPDLTAQEPRVRRYHAPVDTFARLRLRVMLLAFVMLDIFALVALPIQLSRHAQLVLTVPRAPVHQSCVRWVSSVPPQVFRQKCRVLVAVFATALASLPSRALVCLVTTARRGPRRMIHRCALRVLSVPPVLEIRFHALLVNIVLAMASPFQLASA